MRIIHTQYKVMLRHFDTTEWANEFNSQALIFANSSAEFEARNLVSLFKHVLETKECFLIITIGLKPYGCK